MEYGLIGKTLGHSFSKPIHEALGGYPYELKELPDEAAVRAFFTARRFRAVNVTIPYKGLALALCDEVSEEAKAIGAVNTVVNRGGRLFGYNTDFGGFRLLVRHRGVSLAGKTVLILGTGATQRTVRAVCTAEGAAQVLCASRSAKPGALRYEQAAARQDVNVIINASPAGMYPNNGTCLVDLAAPGAFPALEAVFDVVYNPLRTRLLQMAEARGVPCAGGLLMLVAQAKYAAELFLGRPMAEQRILEVYRSLLAEKAGLALVGMPSCGKTGVGKALAKALKKPFVDADAELVRRAGRPISEILQPGNEGPFRQMEAAVTADLAKRGGAVLATGGGVVLREENVRALRENYVVLYLDRPLALLKPGGGRPLSTTRGALEKQLAVRRPLYEAACHARVENAGSFEAAVAAAKEAFYEVLDCEWA